MAYSGEYTRINWENYPSVNTPIDEINLNKIDAAVKKHDETLEAWDGAQGKADKSALAATDAVVATKADQTTVNGTFSSISFDSTTGVFTFTKVNGTSVTINTVLEKVVTNFYYDDDPTSAHYQSLVLTLEDGSTQYVDMSALITQYEFTNSSTISFTVGNDGSVTASVINGSITADKLQPNYLADVTTQATNASNSAKDSEAWAKGTRNGTAVDSSDPAYHNNSKYYSEQSLTNSQTAEAWAKGTRNGVDVPSTDPAYHNNAKYYAENSGTLAGLQDTNLGTLADGDALVYDNTSQKWVNRASGSLSSKMDTDGSNAASHVTFSGAFTVGSRLSGSTVGTNSTVEGELNTASGTDSHAEGYYTNASGNYSHAEGCGYNNVYKVIASGKGAHAEGVATTTQPVYASGTGSHAEGQATTASGYASHAEGSNTTATSQDAHAEGYYTTASGSESHAEGYRTIAGYFSQHVCGKYNDNKATTLFEIGNGDANARSNAFEVYSDGSLSTDNGTTKTKLPVIKTATLTGGFTTVQFINMPSSGNHMVSFSTSKAGLDYSSISQSGTTVTLTYPVQSSDITVWCILTEVV